MDGWADRWMDGWAHRQTDGWMHGQTERQIKYFRTSLHVGPKEKDGATEGKLGTWGLAPV